MPPRGSFKGDHTVEERGGPRAIKVFYEPPDLDKHARARVKREVQQLCQKNIWDPVEILANINAETRPYIERIETTSESRPHQNKYYFKPDLTIANAGKKSTGLMHGGIAGGGLEQAALEGAVNGLEDYQMDERMDGSMEGAAALMKLLAEAVMPQTQPPYADATRQNSGTYRLLP